jgi:glyoxylase-like metal-dependent hydrolase (beta-lactamase superfamily II)
MIGLPEAGQEEGTTMPKAIEIMISTRARWGVCLVLAIAMLLPGSTSGSPGGRPIARDLELEALQEAVHWPNAEVQTVVTLAARFLADRRDHDAYVYFQEREGSQPDRPLFLALEGFFQAREAGQVSLFRRVAWVNEAVARLDRAVTLEPGLPRYFRGLVLAELPRSFGKAEAAVADLDWVLQNKEQFPPGLRRSVYRGLARAYATLGREAEARGALTRSGYPSLDSTLPVFTTDYSVTAQEGFRFRPARLVEMAPRVYVAQGYDFADIAFVLTSDGVVVVDAGTTEANARAALAALRRVTAQPITHVVLTHAHWDHIGGLAAFTAPGVQIVAQARFADELRIVNETGVPFRYFFGAGGQRRYTVVPDRLVGAREALTVGGVEFVLYPVHGGETEDALMIHLPGSGVLFVGDVFMPYFGAPFLPEGSPEEFFDTLSLIRSLRPRLLIHGHPPLTELFTVQTLPGFESTLRELHGRTLQAIGEGRTLAEILQQNILPRTLRTQPDLVLQYLLVRDNFIKRVYHRRSGYWKPDGEGMEVVAPNEWAAALNVLVGEREGAFVRSVRTLLDQGDYAVALKLADLARITYPGSDALAGLRRQALDGLRARNQQLNPFKFIIYSEWAGASLTPVE